MGEYAILEETGVDVKIGTCEDMLYLRYDQRHQVRQQRGSLNPADRETQKQIRFRFPWPDEDNIGPGEFSDPFRRLAVDVPAPTDFEHGIVQFVASKEGYNVCLPCPEGPEADHGLTVHRNGFPGSAFLVQQAVRDGRLVAVMECVCGRRYRLPTIEDAEPVCEALLLKAEMVLRWNKDSQGSSSLIEIARRIRVGYSENLEAFERHHPQVQSTTEGGRG